MEDFSKALSCLSNLRILELHLRFENYWSSTATIAQPIIKACQSVHTLILRRDLAGTASDWWIWKSGMSEIESRNGTRDNNQLWNEEIAKLHI
jgi:hypothetical protein